jgi:DNA polymerase-3 subunit epsilon
MKYLSKLNKQLQKRPLSIIQYNEMLQKGDTFFESIDLETELLLSNGYPIYFSNDNVYLKTTQNLIKDQVFCIVDIETTAGNPKDGQIIEIAAIKYKNGIIIEEYQSLVNCNYIPPYVQEITGINLEMLKDAPNLKDVLEEFKIFLEDDVFVAHSVEFDYKFISDSFKKYDLGQLFNRRLCTIELAERTIVSPKYGLKSLKENLGIDIERHHRAYDDALATTHVLSKCLGLVGEDIRFTECLIDFSKQSDNKVNNENKG